MAKYYGYCYDQEGKFTEMIPLEEKPIYEKQTFYREEIKEIVTEEKLCELHQSIQDSTYVPDQENDEEPISKYECPDCVMINVNYETIRVPYEEDVVVGYEPDIPENCTLEPPIYTDATWDGSKWIYDRDINPPEPTEPENPQTPEEVIRDILLDRIIKLEARTLTLEERFAELENDFKSSIVSGGGTVEKEPMNPEDLPNPDPPSDETPEPKQDLLALYLDSSIGKE
ncbi:hypothetical protein [Bacillus wiedmannii]|uniref:hypothetical protein n=1 Tax=Bacillus wiedmannii TaxID=1890302 RepID=UPI001F50EC48|nr:hypothetical protein [Bacillus wiedmannii]UOB95794.1 hypothetical protein BTI679_31380 [Bacillus wiedmannii]